MFHCSLRGQWRGEGIGKLAWAWKLELNEGRGQNGMKGEKDNINEIKEDVDEHAVSESQKNVSDRPQKQAQGAELIEEEFATLHVFIRTKLCISVAKPSTSQVHWFHPV